MSATTPRSRRRALVSVAVPLGLIAGATLLGAAGSVSLQGTVALALCDLVIVLGLQVFVGNSGIYSFGQLGFAAAGAYVAALLTIPAAFASLQTPELPAVIADPQPGALETILIAAAACGLLAALVGLPLMRTSTLAIPISTFAFLVVVYNVLSNWDAVTGGSAGLVSIPVTTGVGTAGLGAAASVLVALTYKSSASGRRLVATREDEVAARSIGIRVTRERLIAFALSAILCGVGGALSVHQSGVLAPDTFYFGATVTVLTMLVLGGTRSVFGAVIGAFAVTLVNELLHGVEDGVGLFGLISIGETPGLAAIGMGLILLATMIAIPGGISGGREAGELSWFGGSIEEEPTVELRHQTVPARSDAVGEGALRAEGISVAFAGLQALLDVDLRLRSGEILGLIGPNGAGKTTLVNVLSGFQESDAGTVRLNGIEVRGRSPDWLARAGLTRSFQAALPFPHLSGLENVAVGAIAVGMHRRRAAQSAEEVLGRLGLFNQQARAPAGALPPGQQRLLGIARALATRPRFLLLDEPAAGLNDRECERLAAILEVVLEEFGCGILLIEHDMNVVMNLCPRIQVLENGATLLIGTPAEVQADATVIDAYLGSSFPGASIA
jgi:branched-chain amino acid transport system permease protein